MRLFDQLGFNVLANTPASLRYLNRLLPAACGRPYTRALIEAFRQDNGDIRPFSEAEEARWLAEHLNVAALREASEGSRLRKIWTDACALAGVSPDRAVADRQALFAAIEAVASHAVSEDELVRFLATAVRRAA